MTALFEGLTHWHWLGLGFVLLAIEVMGSVGFLLWTGIAALEVGLLLLVWPFGWQAQLLLFALQSLLTTWAWWRWQHRRDRSGLDAAAADPFAAPAKKNATKVKKRAPIASKSKPASEVAKTPLPSANLDLSLPRDMVEELEPVGTVTLPKRPAVLPQMFGDKASPFQLNGRLISNEMQLQLRNEERREVDGAALEFEFKR